MSFRFMIYAQFNLTAALRFAKISTVHFRTLRMNTGRRLLWIFWPKSPYCTQIWPSHLDTGMETCCFSSAGLLAHCRPLLTGMLYCHELGLWNVSRGSVTVASAENEGKRNFLSSILSKVSPKLLQASIMLLVSVTHTDRKTVAH